MTLLLKEVMYTIYSTYRNRVHYNTLNKSHKKNALLSFITSPLNDKKSSTGHTNENEFRILLNTLDLLGYNVDVCNFNTRYRYLDYTKYDVIVGFGWAVENALKSNCSAYTVLYATGSHFEYNQEQIKKSIYKSKFFQLGSYRNAEMNLFLQHNFTDAVLCLGNKERAKDFMTFKGRKVKSAFLPAYQLDKYRTKVYPVTENNRYNLVWFGSTGIIHKGLHLLIDFVMKNKKYSLTICGNVEQELQSLYSQTNILKQPNIKFEGFIGLGDDKYERILSGSAFTILPSCSEGIPGALITPILNGGLLPITSKNTGLHLDESLIIKELTVEGIESVLFPFESINIDSLNALIANTCVKVKAQLENESFDIAVRDVLSNVKKS